LIFLFFLNFFNFIFWEVLFNSGVFFGNDISDFGF
jgi:hypothetical protein